jgi:hypothetical protein
MFIDGLTKKIIVMKMYHELSWFAALNLEACLAISICPALFSPGSLQNNGE